MTPTNVERRDRLELRYATKATSVENQEGDVVSCVNRNQFAGGYKVVEGAEDNTIPTDFKATCANYWRLMNR